MKNKLELLVKHKKAGKSITIGKVVGGIAGIATGFIVGKEMPEFTYLNCDYILFGIKLSPALILGYMGQRTGGYIGVVYYFRKRRKTSKF